VNILTTIGFSIACLLFIGLGTTVHAQETVIEKQQLYIGITESRTPYTNLDNENQPQGVLVEIVNTLCREIDAHCKYMLGEPDQLLRDLEGYKLHALVTLDSHEAKQNKQVQLTTPLCHIRSVFIQRQNNAYEKLQDIEGTTLGVKNNTSLHLYLTESYEKSAKVRPYPTLESGVFDLVSGRIDALFADKAFFKARVAHTSLTNKISPERLIAREISSDAIPKTNMAFVVREQDKELLSTLEKAIQDQGKTRHCDCLLNTKKSEKLTTEKAVPND